ncbi:MAG: nitroreductase family protein [Planctomycetaceae bacterium]|nr:nitroreductase family protein [Planctomycetaceae bacterium]
MELFETIAKRFSFRGDFEDVRVDRETLKKIVQAGIDAPSGCNAQTTSFVIVDDAKLIAEIASLFADRPVCKTAKAMIVCLADPTPAYGTTSFDREDCATAVQNMLLAITAVGLATVWIQGYVQRDDNDKKIARLLGVAEPLRVEVVLPVGIPKTDGKPNVKKPFDQRAFFNQYQKDI